MKKLVLFLTAFIIVAFCFSACSKTPKSNQADINRDAQGYVQFIADFNTGLFAFTNKNISPKSLCDVLPYYSSPEKSLQ